MSLEEKAKQARSKADSIHSVARQIMDRCDDVLMQRQVGDETIEFSQAQKQILIGDYQTLKAQLQKLVEELP